MNQLKTARQALVGLAAPAAVAVGLGSPAQASVTSNGCTVDAVTPYHNGDFTAGGDKLINYEIDVSCTGAATVTAYMERWEDDPNQVDDLIGTSTIVTEFTVPEVGPGPSPASWQTLTTVSTTRRRCTSGYGSRSPAPTGW
jgi:hypothetical protein